jgi:Leucine-rich repeat (LRR) protein
MGTDDDEIVEQLDLSQARSIGAFGDIRRLPALAKSKSLRVLDLRDCDMLGNHHIKGIEKLYQLRYLDISGTGITELPREIGDLMYLETLLTSRSDLHELPESATRLRRLARLFVSSSCKLPDVWGNLVNLQELEKIDALQLKHVEQLGKLTNLRTLGINLCSDGIEADKLV